MKKPCYSLEEISCDKSITQNQQMILGSQAFN